MQIDPLRPVGLLRDRNDTREISHFPLLLFSISKNLCYTLAALTFDFDQEEQPFWEIVLIIPNDGPAKQSGFFVGQVQSEKMDRGWQEVS